MCTVTILKASYCPNEYDDLCQSDQHLNSLFFNAGRIKTQLFTVGNTNQMCSTPNYLQQRNIYFLRLSVKNIRFNYTVKMSYHHA